MEHPISRRRFRMIRIPALAAAFLLLVPPVFSANFSPSALKLSAPARIQYDFDGHGITIPVTVSGAPASVSFLVFTRGKASDTGNVTNGYLGWHQVNKIDTCLYFSPFKSMSKGVGSLTWNGRDESGATVPAGDYTYYLWGCDRFSPRVLMTRQMSFDPWGFRTIITHNARGEPLAQPLIYITDRVRSTAPDPVSHTNFKWKIGDDPENVTLRETTRDRGWCDVGGLAFLPDSDFTRYYFHDTLKEGNYKITRKWEWVPNGDAVLQTAWGNDGRFTYTGDWPKGWNFGPGCVSDGQGNLFLVNADISGAGAESQLIYLDIDTGTERKRFDLSPWWVDFNDSAVYGQATGGPTALFLRNGRLFLGSHTSCVNQMLDPYAGDEADIVRWTNTNGDYTGDKNFSPGSELQWVCNDFNVAPWKFNISADENLFSVFPCYGVGAFSFGLYAPDGTGMGYLALSSETGAQKYGVECISSGSAYDGLYTTSNAGGVLDTSWWYVGQDSIEGIITTRTGVTDGSPSAFTLAQNSPNPFNPSTVIRLALARSGMTTVEIFNTSGQKVDAILTADLEAGEHTVVWNAARFAAGVYFCTVRSGNGSRTIKMTLLR